MFRKIFEFCTHGIDPASVIVGTISLLTLRNLLGLIAFGTTIWWNGIKIYKYYTRKEIEKVDE